ncbi:unnamed protein product [Rhizoctonia solani]|uniref:Uncharacterized protein n=1 Tax=Rhizoctonia solani TaxID=456999 RepID=A0A8H3CAH8_9AGAM|nr:unnamed protein product [Rhizoctonia solani]
MSTLTDKLSAPVMDEEKLEQGTISTKDSSSSEPTFTWSNPGPLFKSARRILIISLITWMIVVVLGYFIEVDTPMYQPKWPSYNTAPISYSAPAPKPPKFKICCIEGFRLMLDSRRDPPPENCGLCLDGPYRILYEDGASNY